jgi:hypothetical protein
MGAARDEVEIAHTLNPRSARAKSFFAKFGWITTIQFSPSRSEFWTPTILE